MLQILVPSRLESPEYRAQRDEIELQVAHVNGRFGAARPTPVEYVHRSISAPELAALYRRADVMAVTPLRDGMNLVAQEFVLCQSAEPRCRDAGAARSSSASSPAPRRCCRARCLSTRGISTTSSTKFIEALELDPEERRRRLGLMAERVEQLDCRRWAETFLPGSHATSAAIASPAGAAARRGAARERIAQRFVRARRRTLLLDYDGTLRELASHPDLAAPTKEIVELLGDLAALPDTDVHVVSGRRARHARAVVRRPADLPLRRARLSRARAGRAAGSARRRSTSRGCRASNASCAA